MFCLPVCGDSLRLCLRWRSAAAADLFSPERPAVNTATDFNASAADYIFSADASAPERQISDMLIGVFFEDINFAADGGLYAEMVANRSFEFTSLAADDALYRWSPVGNVRAQALQMDGLNENNPSFLRLTNPDSDPAGMENAGFLAGMALEAADYKLSLYARSADENCGTVTVRLVSGDAVAAEGEITGISSHWQKFAVALRSDFAATENVRLQVLIPGGTVDLDMVSLFPADTFMGRENGLRADLAQLVADLSPKFLRFPGGCVIEGVDDDTDYSWKDSVGVGADGLPLAFTGSKKTARTVRTVHFLFAYFTMLAISAAKSSAFFSMPSPFSKRTKPVALISAPRFFATLAIYAPTLPSNTSLRTNS